MKSLTDQIVDTKTNYVKMRKTNFSLKYAKSNIQFGCIHFVLGGIGNANKSTLLVGLSATIVH